MDVLNDIFAWSVGTIIVTFIVSILICFLIVLFWTWIITKIALEVIDKHKRKYSTPEIELLNIQIQQLENQITATLKTKNSIEQLNKTVEKLSERIENHILFKNSSHL